MAFCMRSILSFIRKTPYLFPVAYALKWNFAPKPLSPVMDPIIIFQSILGTTMGFR